MAAGCWKRFRSITSYSRPGARILLFSQTSDKERIEVSGADICKDERTLFGCYSASVDLQKESANLVFSALFFATPLVWRALSGSPDEPGTDRIAAS